ncbi:MAG: hypothetical protein JWP34_1273 [Massilia sp.]|nr:hypothetical protein [Massilia sp.]
MKIHTIGFTKSSAGHFFTRLKDSKAARLVDASAMAPAFVTRSRKSNMVDPRF